VFRIAARARDFSFTKHVSKISGAHTASYSMGNWRSYRGGKAAWAFN